MNTGGINEHISEQDLEQGTGLAAYLTVRALLEHLVECDILSPKEVAVVVASAEESARIQSMRARESNDPDRERLLSSVSFLLRVIFAEESPYIN